MPPYVFFEILTAPSTRPDKQPLSIVNAIANLDWRAPIIAFLRGHYEPVETHDFERMQLELGATFSRTTTYSS
jgi:hypothetical protein